MGSSTPVTLRQIIRDLRAQTGHARELGSEDGVPKLDWVEGAERLLARPAMLQKIEQEAQDILDRGIRHIIWAGMGGSIMTVQVLRDMQVFTGSGVTVYPLDSTDPAAMNAIVTAIACAKSIPILPGDSTQLHRLLDDVLMVGVAMGMTSEEPISHAEWFAGLLDHAGLAADRHLLVMALPHSLLDQFAREKGIPTTSIQPDGGTGTGGRMSAPTTRVFLLPAALSLGAQPGCLHHLLEQAWKIHDLDGAARMPERHPFVRLATILSDAADHGVCALFLDGDTGWESLFPWVEQLMEESLGKGGRGVLVFEANHVPEGLSGHRPGMPRVLAGTLGPVLDMRTSDQPFALLYPSLVGQAREESLAAIAAVFLGWQLAMAIYGILEDIIFAGQPAVESYKTRARALRTTPSPIEAVRASGSVFERDRLLFLAPRSDTNRAAEMVVPTPESVLGSALRTLCHRYFDVTVNGEIDAETEKALRHTASLLATDVAQVPTKLRRAPAAYHSTEQSEMDGPDGLVSLRIVGFHHDQVLLGEYDHGFLLAQAAGTWQAMVEQGKFCCLLAFDGTTAEACRQAIEVLRSILTIRDTLEP